MFWVRKFGETTDQKNNKFPLENLILWMTQLTSYKIVMGDVEAPFPENIVTAINSL